LYIFNESSRAAVYGVGTYIRELTAALKDSSINVCVIHLRADKPQILTEETDNVRNWYFPPPVPDPRTTDYKKQNEQYYRNVAYLLQLHIKDRNNLVFHLNYSQSGKLAEALKQAFDCRIVAVVHYSNWGFAVYDNLPRLRSILNEEHPDNFGENLKKSFEEEKSFYSKVDTLICLSEYMREILCRDYGLDAKKISVIPNGLTDVADTSGDKRFLRKKWNIPAGEKIILFAGRIDKVKGLSYLITAFRKVLEKIPGCRLMIAGSGHYDAYFRESKEMCTKITFTGLLEKKDLYEIYQMADVGVVASLFEPFGYVAVEMMMHGLPIVATATSGLNEVVDDTCALKVPVIEHPDRVEIDTDLLAEKIPYLLQHPKEAKQMGRNGRKRYLQYYTSDIFRENMVELYHSLLGHTNYLIRERNDTCLEVVEQIQIINTDPLISVMIPVYNAEAFLRDTIDSVLCQTFRDFELLLLDDGSTDGSAGIIQSYHDTRIRYVPHPHDFIGTLNHGYGLARGKYIAQLDHDDLMVPQRLQIQYDYMEAHPRIAACGGWMHSFGKHSGVIRVPLEHRQIVPDMLLHGPILNPTGFVRRDILLEHHIRYRQEYSFYADYKFWLEVAMVGQLANIPGVLTLYRTSDGQATEKYLPGCWKIARKIKMEVMEYLFAHLKSEDQLAGSVRKNLLPTLRRLGEKDFFSDRVFFRFIYELIVGLRKEGAIDV
jgi:glycosyltransferase